MNHCITIMIPPVTIPTGMHYDGLRFCQPGKQTSKELLWTFVKHLQGPHQPAAHVTKIWATSRPVTAPHGSLVMGALVDIGYPVLFIVMTRSISMMGWVYRGLS